jgi:hypothetical protein
MTIDKADELSESPHRDRILALLTHEETARISNVKAQLSLLSGDEYLDLDRLDRGLQCAIEPTESQGRRVIRRKSVRPAAWTQIMATLPKMRSSR